MIDEMACPRCGQVTARRRAQPSAVCARCLTEKVRARLRLDSRPRKETSAHIMLLHKPQHWRES